MQGNVHTDGILESCASTQKLQNSTPYKLQTK